MAVELLDDGAHRGEYRRETGNGRIVELKPGGRNTHVIIDAEHLREPVAGWADTTDRELMARIAAAHEGATRIAYVVDTHRKGNVSADRPFDELDRSAKVRAVTDIYRVDANGAPVDHAPAPATSTPPAAAPKAPPAEAPTPAPPSSAAPATGPARPCPKCGHPLGTAALRRDPELGFVHVDCPQDATPSDPADDAFVAELADAMDEGPAIGAGEGPTLVEAGLAATEARARHRAQEGAQEGPSADEEPSGPESDATPPQEPQEGDTGGMRPPSPRPARRRARIEELKPWERYNVDGTPNLGSYAFTAAVGMVELAIELIIDLARTDAATRGVPMTAPAPGRVRSLALALLNATDRVQANVRADGLADRMDMSHTRARGAVRTALDSYPVPWGATAEERAAWLDDLVELGTMALTIAIDVESSDRGVAVEREAGPS